MGLTTGFPEFIKKIDERKNEIKDDSVSNANPRPVRIRALIIFSMIVMFMLHQHGYQEATLPCVSTLVRPLVQKR